MTITEIIFLCLGDSLTAGYPGYSPSNDGISNGSGNIRSQYEYWLKKFCLDYLEMNLGSLEDDIIENLIFINKGIPGELTGQFLSRIESDLLNVKPEPEYSIILGGTNDLGWGISLEKILNNIKDLHTISRDAGIISIGGTIPPILYESSEGGYHDQKMKINKMLSSYFRENNIPFVDLYSGMSDDQGNLKKQYAYADGLHFSVDGYKQMAQALYKDVIKAIIQKKYL